MEKITSAHDQFGPGATFQNGFCLKSEVPLYFFPCYAHFHFEIYALVFVMANILPFILLLSHFFWCLSFVKVIIIN